MLVIALVHILIVKYLINKRDKEEIIIQKGKDKGKVIKNKPL